jgi:hypothetical protein
MCVLCWQINASDDDWTKEREILNTALEAKARTSVGAGYSLANKTEQNVF